MLLKDRLIKQEAKKKTETPAERRRRSRRENTGKTQSSGPLGFLTVKGVGAKKMTQCRVRLLDGTDYDFELEVRQLLIHPVHTQLIVYVLYLYTRWLTK